MLDQCVILCGGLGSRLAELTKATPKPLLPIAGTPFLEHLVAEVTRQGCRRILLLAAFESQQIREFAENSSMARHMGATIQVAVEPDRAGTGGALWHARQWLDDEFLMLNGDSWFDVPLVDLVTDLASAPSLVAAIALRALPDASRFGGVELDGHRVTAFHPRPTGSGPGLVNGGVYALRKTILDFITPNCSLEHDVFPRLAGQDQMAGRRADGFFIDIGIPESYADAQQSIPRHRRRPALFFGLDALLAPTHGAAAVGGPIEWAQGAREALRAVNRRGWYVFLFTGREIVGADQIAEARLGELKRQLDEDLAQICAHIDDHQLRLWPGRQEAVQSRREPDCFERSRAALAQLLTRWPVALESSLVVASSRDEVDAGASCGLRTHRVDDGYFQTFPLTALDPLTPRQP